MVAMGCPPITFNDQNWTCALPSLPSPLLLLMLSSLLSQPTGTAIPKHFGICLPSTIQLISKFFKFLWHHLSPGGHQLFMATTELLLQLSSPWAQTCCTSYPICQPQLFLLQSIQPDASKNAIFFSLRIH